MSQESERVCCLKENKSLHQRRIDVSLQHARRDWSEDTPEGTRRIVLSFLNDATHNTYFVCFGHLDEEDVWDGIFKGFFDPVD